MRHRTRGTRAIEVHEGSGNVYRDLGFPHAENMLVKAQLVLNIREIIHSKGLTQVNAARILGLSERKLSCILRGQFRGESERMLVDRLAKLVADAEVVR